MNRLNRCLVCDTEIVDDKCDPKCIMMEDAPNIGCGLDIGLVFGEKGSRVIEHPPEPTLAMRELFRRHDYARRKRGIRCVEDLVDFLREAAQRGPEREQSGVCVLVKRGNEVMPIYTISKMTVAFDGVDEVNIVVNVDDDEE